MECLDTVGNLESYLVYLEPVTACGISVLTTAWGGVLLLAPLWCLRNYPMFGLERF